MRRCMPAVRESLTIPHDATPPLLSLGRCCIMSMLSLLLAAATGAAWANPNSLHERLNTVIISKLQ